MFNMDKIRQGALRFVQLNRAVAIILCVALALTGSVILGNTAKIIRIADGERNYLIRSLSGNIPAALSAAGLRSDNYRIVSSETTDRTTSVNIEYLFPVFITVGEETKEFETSAATIGEILSAAGYSVDKYDMIQPAADTLVEDTVYIDYTNIDYVSGQYTEAIAYKTVTVTDGNMAAGTEKVEGGKNGSQQVNYTEKYVNGVKTETKIESKVLLSAAVDAKRTVGTKFTAPQAVKTSADVKSVSTLKPNAPIELDANGVPVKYTKKITSRATAYTYTGNNCSTGVAPQPGYIAVNPNYIPYGTRMYIKTVDGRYIYGYAVAADTGGFIKRHPTGVDLFMSSESACRAFGVRTVEIYILP